jgi:undecaprenyl diphosphate synthase
MPKHVAIIMDGNGRWAQARGLPRAEGHRKGISPIRPILEYAADKGISYLSLFGFSTENWRRPAEEISVLMDLMRYLIKKELAELHKEGVRFKVIGDRTKLAQDIQDLISHAEDLTKNNTNITLNIAINYGGRQDITQAAKRIAHSVKKGELQLNDITPEIFETRLYTSDMPDPDLMIRPSGEQRISNFMMWQFAYTELVFQDVLWPDYSVDYFQDALDAYAQRERRFGGTPA